MLKKKKIPFCIFFPNKSILYDMKSVKCLSIVLVMGEGVKWQ
jgi:hypothetical protein